MGHKTTTLGSSGMVCQLSFVGYYLSCSIHVPNLKTQGKKTLKNLQTASFKIVGNMSPFDKPDTTFIYPYTSDSRSVGLLS